MAFARNVWNQVKNLTKGEIIRALERDNWKLEQPSHSSGSVRLYLKFDENGVPLRRVEMHFHRANETCGRKLLAGILDAAGWTETDMKRLKLIK